MNRFNILDFGAISDGKTDCTAAIQQALDEAGKVNGTVYVPAGKFLCKKIKVPKYVSLVGEFAWTFGNYGGSELVLNTEDADCMVDITAGFGCRIDGLSINGADKGENINGVQIDWNDRLKSREEFGGKEDTPTISNCRIGNFSGNAVHFNNVWCFSIRHSMLCFSENGLYMNGCDCFVQDNWFSVNRGAGILSDRRFMSGTFGGNRIECNFGEGVKFNNLGYAQFNGNYWDFNHGCGFSCYGTDNDFDFRGHISFTGNIFYRDGLFDTEELKDKEKYESSHILISDACNVLINSNDFGIGGGEYGKLGPNYSIVHKNLCNSIISGNTMMCGSKEKNILSLGGELGQVIVKDNVGGSKDEEQAQDFPRYTDKVK